MDLFAVLLLAVTIGGVFFAPRRWAVLSFLVGCCYMTVGQGVVIAGLNLPMVRILLIAGIARVVMKHEGLADGLNTMDKVVIAWSAWLLFASLFHVWAPGSGPKYTSGAVLNTTGCYFMIRSLCRGTDELRNIIAGLCVILAPVAVCMVVEQAIRYNIFSIFGGVQEIPTLRNGRYRAQGPFNHAILAGTVGASCFPLAIALWHSHRKAAIIGIGASLLMVVTSASSGPILSMAFSLVALGLWNFRWVVTAGLYAAVPVYVLLALVMERPPYFLISKIDLTGASSSWHRSFLIQQTIEHLNEWWLFGTDVTKHWMPNQGHISSLHTDITNQYIAYGVAGGLICMGLVIAVMVMAFRTMWRISGSELFPVGERYLLWCVGASLFAHATSAMSVGYFGQALFFFWFPIALLGSFYNVERPETDEGDEDEGDEEEEEPVGNRDWSGHWQPLPER